VSGVGSSTTMESKAYHVWELSGATNPDDRRRIMPLILESYGRILDVGCGAGQTMIASNLAAGVEAIGVDLNRSMRDWYTQSAAARVCSMDILSTTVVTAGS
jgi:cyclopropane fatty-acyl-phospholipid synthase-like methyltransferase